MRWPVAYLSVLVIAMACGSTRTELATSTASGEQTTIAVAHALADCPLQMRALGVPARVAPRDDGLDGR